MQINGTQYDLKSVHLAYSTAEAAETSTVLDTDGFNGLGLCVAFESALAEGETLTLTVEADSGTTSGYTPSFETILTATVVATGGVGGSTEKGTTYLPLNIQTYNRYVTVRTTLATSVGTNNIDYTVTGILTDPETRPFTTTTVTTLN